MKIEVLIHSAYAELFNLVKMVREVSKGFNNVEVSCVDVSKPSGREKALSYGVDYVPSIVINGKVVFVGLPDKEKVKQLLREGLKGRAK
jgi:predicted thioredoxin/glutaredoxin